MRGVIAMSGPIKGPWFSVKGEGYSSMVMANFAPVKRLLMVSTLGWGVAWSQEPPETDPLEATEAGEVADAPSVTVLRDQIRVTGIVVHPVDGQPLPGAMVQAVSAQGVRVEVTTDIEGSFSLKSLADGEWTITATFPDLEATSATVTVSSTQVIDLQFTMGGDQISGSDKDLVIEARKETAGVTERVIEREEIQYLPGTGGDAVKVVQNLPGVARPPLGVGQLIIRGVDPEDSSFFLDGGQNSPGVSLFGFDHGDRPTQYPKWPIYREPMGFVSAEHWAAWSICGRRHRYPPKALVSCRSMCINRLSLVNTKWVVREEFPLSARRSYVDAVLNPILNSGERRVQAPRYYDAQLRYWNVRPDGARWDAYLFLSDDRFLVLGSDDPDAAVDIGLVTQFQKVRLQHLRPLGRGWYSESVLFGGPETQSFQFEGDGEAYEKNWVVGLRQEFRLLNDGQGPDLKLGLDVEAGQVSYLYDVAGFGESEEGSTPVLMPALYAESTWTLGFWN